MFSISISPEWICQKLGINADPELLELVATFLSRMRNAPDKAAFAKTSLRKALGYDR